MANRFTDTDLWKKPWFRKASPHIKCLFRYMVDNCDHAGVLDVDLGLMSYMIGEEITDADLKSLDFLYIHINNDKIFMPSFVEFQYKVSSFSELNESNNAHKSVINKLKRHNLLGANEGLKCSSQGAQDKDIDKDMELVKVKDGIYLYVFDFWNTTTKDLPQARKLTDKIESAINGITKDGLTLDDIKHSIVAYNHIANGEQYYFTYRWGLLDFLKINGGCRRFADVKDDKQYLKNSSSKSIIISEECPYL